MLEITATLVIGSVFTDPTGDSGSAPDITTVEVSNDPVERFTIRITLANRPHGLGKDEQVIVLLDTERSPANGDATALGANYLILVDGTGRTYAVGSWNGASYTRVATPTMSVVQAGAIVVSFGPRDLPAAHGFDFWIRALEGNGSVGHFDDAPDNGTWAYRPQSVPPAPDSVADALDPAATSRFTNAVSKTVLSHTGRQLEFQPGAPRLAEPPAGATAPEARRSLAVYGCAALVYITIGVAVPDFLFSMYVGTAYLLLTVWVVPSLWRRLR